MILKIQLTAMLFAIAGLFWMKLDVRSVNAIPYWQVAVITIPTLMSLAIFFIASLLRIWL